MERIFTGQYLLFEPDKMVIVPPSLAHEIAEKVLKDMHVDYDDEDYVPLYCEVVKSIKEIE
jgi:hypothetical protein